MFARAGLPGDGGNTFQPHSTLFPVPKKVQFGAAIWLTRITITYFRSQE
jgi:hypothetical protein